VISELIDKVGMQKYLRSWTFVGAIIMSGSRKAMNGKQHSPHIAGFEPTVMYFGLMNSPATFQAMMNAVMRT